MIINFSKSQNYLVFLITLFLLLSIFSGFGDILLIKDYFITAPKPGINRFREFLEIKQYSIYFKYTFIFTVTILNIFFFLNVVNKLTIINKQNYWLIHIFFIFLIISYLSSYFIYFELKFLKKVLLIIFLYNSFLFFSLNEINQNFTKSLIKSIEITLLATLIIFLIVNYIGNMSNNYFEFVNWPRHTGIISFINIRGNPITFILLCLFAFHFKFEKSRVNRFLIFIICFFLVFMLQSRLGIISLFLFLIFFSFNNINNQKLHSIFCYLAFFIIISYTFLGAFIINILFETFNNQTNIIKEPYLYFENIKQTCPFNGLNYKEIFNQHCDDILFKISGNFEKSSELFNFLNSFLYRLSYQYEALNIMISNNFKPILSEFNQMGSSFITDIGQIRFENNLFTNAHNSFLLISLRITLLGTILIFTFLYLICRKLIKLNEFKYLTLIIFIIFFHSFDDFFVGNHFAASLITWIMLGIFFNKIKNA